MAGEFIELFIIYIWSSESISLEEEEDSVTDSSFIVSLSKLLSVSSSDSVVSLGNFVINGLENLSTYANYYEKLLSMY